MSESDVINECTVTCPVCSTARIETMPSDSCQYFYECTGCHTLLRPKPGDCCVFCSYGSVPCPPVQLWDGSPLSCQSNEGRVIAEIRPGVQRPDWSVVTKLAARDALLARSRTGASPQENWHHALQPLQDTLWRSVLTLFADQGWAPSIVELASHTGVPATQVRSILLTLQRHDLLGLDQAAQTIKYAYPFAGESPGHCVSMHGRTLNALCAIDALGAGSMYRLDTMCSSSFDHGSLCRGPRGPGGLGDPPVW